VAGNTIQGSFACDTDTPVWFKPEPGTTVYKGVGALGAMTLNIAENGFSFATSRRLAFSTTVRHTAAAPMR
jgi:hypothetical protein